MGEPVQTVSIQGVEIEHCCSSVNEPFTGLRCVKSVNSRIDRWIVGTQEGFTAGV